MKSNTPITKRVIITIFLAAFISALGYSRIQASPLEFNIDSEYSVLTVADSGSQTGNNTPGSGLFEINRTNGAIYIQYSFWMVIIVILAVLGVVFITILIWNVMLRKAVYAKTLALQHELNERRQARESAEKARDYTQNLIDSSLDMIVSVDRDGCIHEFNQAAVDTFGYSQKEILGTDVSILYADEKDVEEVMRGIESRGRFTGEIKNIRKNGEVFSALLSAAVLRDSKGEIIGSIGTSRDITDLKMKEAARLESERQYRELFNSIGDLIFTHDLNGIIKIVNPSMANLLGYQSEEIIGKSLEDFLENSINDNGFQSYIDSTIEQGGVEGLYRLVDRAGRKHFIELKTVLVKQADRPVLVNGLARDITERKMAEDELQWMQEQLIQAQKMEAIGTLASGIAHDFNNILQAISGYIQLMYPKVQSNDGNVRYLDSMTRKVERAADLVSGLLTFSRRVEPDLKPVDLHAEAKEVKQILERTIPRMITIEIDMDDDLWTVNGDENQLEQVLFNLATNAKDAMPDGGMLTFEAANVVVSEESAKKPAGLAPGNYVLLKVRDTGVGMKKETVEHVFEPFFTTKQVGEGTGLGLPSVYGIVQGHKGHIQCHSEFGKGTSFNIHLPAIIDGRPNRNREEPGQDICYSGSETILLVDDDEAIIEITREIFQGAGYSILTATSGEQALELYREKSGLIRLVILDLNMPGMGGRQCLDKLLEMDPAINVLVASGYSSGGTAASLGIQDAKGFIAKPYRLSNLLGKVRSILDKC